MTDETVVYCPHRGGLKVVCETPAACAGGADCRRVGDLLSDLRGMTGMDHANDGFSGTCPTCGQAYCGRLQAEIERLQDRNRRLIARLRKAGLLGESIEALNGDEQRAEPQP